MRYFWKKAVEEHSPGAYKLWGLINTHCNYLKT